VTLVCAYCAMLQAAGRLPGGQGITFTRPRYMVRQSALHFCSKQHWSLHYHERRRRQRPCRQCGTIIQRKGRAVLFCDRTCYTAWREGSTRRPYQAERRILAAHAAGTRGVRALARASGTSTTTVMKLIRLGRLQPA